MGLLWTVMVFLLPSVSIPEIPMNKRSMVPLEKKLLEDFSLSRLVVCTDGGLSALSNRRYNSKGNRGFITTQSIKKLKGFLKDGVLILKTGA